MFRQDIDPRCEYCRFATALGGDEFACLKRGLTQRHGRCSKFRYDPIKREPEPKAKLRDAKLTREDFEL